MYPTGNGLLSGIYDRKLIGESWIFGNSAFEGHFKLLEVIYGSPTPSSPLTNFSRRTTFVLYTFIIFQIKLRVF